jgi:molecular chaperone DnaK (HSP70)
MAIFRYEGERTQCRDNRLLGEFELTGIPPMLRGQAELVTTFEVDANGLLKVSAMDRASGRKASISQSFHSPHNFFSNETGRHYQLCWPSLIS